MGVVMCDVTEGRVSRGVASQHTSQPWIVMPVASKSSTFLSISNQESNGVSEYGDLEKVWLSVVP